MENEITSVLSEEDQKTIKDIVTDAYVEDLADMNAIPDELSGTDTDSPFGFLDIEEIPECLPKNTYRMRLTSAKKSTSRDGDKDFWVVGFEVDDPDQEDFRGEEPNDLFINMHPRITKSAYDAMTMEDQRKIKNDVRFYRQILRAFGYSDDEIAKGPDITDRIGKLFSIETYVDSRNGDAKIVGRTVKLYNAVDDSAFDVSDLDI